MSDRCRPRKRHHFATPSLQSDMVDARDAAVGAIVAAAGGLAVGLAKLASSGWLASVPAFGMRGWQILSVGAFAVNVASVGIPGRVDGEMAEEAKRVMAAKKAAKADGKAETQEPAGIPRAHWSRGLVSPAGWAFAIWGPIFLGESAFAAMVGNPALVSSNPRPPLCSASSHPSGQPRAAYRRCGARHSGRGPGGRGTSGSRAHSSPRRPPRWGARTALWYWFPASRGTPCLSARTFAATSRSRCTSAGSPPPRW